MTKTWWKRSAVMLCLSTAWTCSNGLAQDTTPAPGAPVAQAPASQPTGPKRTFITLSLKGTGPQEAFDEIAKQAGIKFTTQNNLWEQDSMQEPIDVDFQSRPFWSAVRELCSELKVQPQMNYGRNNGRRILLQQVYGGNNSKMKRWDELPSAEGDGVMVQAIAFNRQQTINYQNMDQGGNYCSVQLMAYVDPAIRVSSFNGGAKVDEAVDDNGNSLVPDDKNRVTYGNNGERSMIYNVNVPLKYPEKNPGKKIAKLRCTLTLRGGDKVDTLAVDKPLEAGETSKQFGDTTVTFYSLKKTTSGGEGRVREQYTLKVGFARDDDDRGGSDFYNMLQGSQLVDAKGRALSYSGGGSSNNTFTATFSARGGDEGEGAAGEPVKWSLELPTGTKTIKVPVEFKDLPMP